jgi:galactose mutarotase-like enzyme
MIILENEFLRAVMAPKGAELQSLLHKATGIEHMWSGDTTYWGKYSPVLFPIVGSLKNDTYIYRDKSYSLPRHGFAREKIFKEESISSTEAVFTLTHDLQTLAVFPFKFILKLRYRLNEASLSCTYEVENPGTEDLLFSLGAHPAFAVPFLTTGTAYNDYYLQFSKDESLLRWKLKDGLISDKTSLLANSNNRLDLSAELFYEDAIVLKNMQSNTITAGCNKHEHGFHFSFCDFPFFGIWAAKDAPFVCLEPWCGIADSIFHNQQLENKEGIQHLPPGAPWQRTWSIACF